MIKCFFIRRMREDINFPQNLENMIAMLYGMFGMNFL